MTNEEAETKARESLKLAVYVIENWFADGRSLDDVQGKITEYSTSDIWLPILLQTAQSIYDRNELAKAQEALKKAGTQ